jgi:hypothetical protein
MPELVHGSRTLVLEIAENGDRPFQPVLILSATSDDQCRYGTGSGRACYSGSDCGLDSEIIFPQVGMMIAYVSLYTIIRYDSAQTRALGINKKLYQSWS